MPEGRVQRYSFVGAGGSEGPQGDQQTPSLLTQINRPFTVPPEAERAVSLADKFLKSQGLEVGELIHCHRIELREDPFARSIQFAPEEIRLMVKEMLAKIPPEKRPRSQWQLTYKKPAPECWEGSYWTTTIAVYDDGVVELQGKY